MLKHLSIKNVAVIEEVNIDFYQGFSVLTGETGAGKSIIIDSIKLLKGDRGSKAIIRSGEEKARVTGVFEVNDDVAREIAEILGSELESEVIVSRELSTDGKNTIRINGMPANLTMLKAVGENLINIHGQHESTSLLSVKTHMNLLDSYGGQEICPILKEYKEAYKNCKEINEKLESADTDEKERARRLDMISYQIKEIEEANLIPGEDTELEERKIILNNSAKISENINRAYDTLYGGEEGTAHDLLWSAINCLEKISGYDKDISDIYESLSGLAEEIGEKIRDLRNISENLSFDGEEADRIEERLDLIANLKRKYGSTVEEILEFYDKITQEEEELKNNEKSVEDLKAEFAHHLKILNQKSDVLTALRQKYAKILSEKVMEELKDLNMANVEFMVSIKRAETHGPSGIDDVEFMVGTNIGEEIKPLAKIASGGELSRIMLAIKSVILDFDKVKTSVFDEIDTGVSGAAAQKIGEKLLKMSKNNSVICITHLPQIAALADNHYLIEKEVQNSRTSTKVKLLDYEQRTDEIARTLSGNEITEITRNNAKQLLDRKK